MPDHCLMWSAPRPFSPATAMRTVSLAPRTRPDDLVPAMVTSAPAPAALRKSRRLDSGMERFLSGGRATGGTGRLLRYHRIALGPRKLRLAPSAHRLPTLVQQELLPPQYLEPCESTALLKVAAEIADADNVLVDEPPQRVHVLLRLHPGAQVRFIGEILVRHVAGVTAVGHLANGVDAQERNDGARRVAADLLVGDQPLTGHNHALRRAG